MTTNDTETAHAPPAVELVILLDEGANPIGSADKRLVHTEATPLHLAFSCYLFDEDGNVLVTRRALSKLTWPGVWTNSFCGHPAPGEDIESAITRRAAQELGTSIRDIQIVKNDFHYRATDANGIVENEVCPVYRATIAGALTPHPDEVAEWAWVNPASLGSAATQAPFAFSPWLVLQLPFVQEDTADEAQAAPAFSTRVPR